MSTSGRFTVSSSSSLSFITFVILLFLVSAALAGRLYRGNSRDRTPENASHVTMFVAFLFARVPSWRENLDNLAAQIASR
jgi:hypothetical protein